MEIQMLSKKLIGPSSPTPNHRRTLNISPVDVIVPPVYMAAIGYYPAPDNVDLEKTRRSMETSLSENLTMFYPFAGRYDEKSHTVDCNDQGVEYVEARVNCDLARIMYGKARAEELDGLAPEGAETEIETETAPLMLIQVNVFECGGVAVGIRFSHRIADAMTVSMFVNGWTTACRQDIYRRQKGACPFVGIIIFEGMKSVIPPNFDLGYIFPVKANKEGWVRAHNPWKKEPSNIVTKRFVFDKQAISSLRAIQPRVSRVMAVTALLWKSFMKAGSGAGDRDRGSLATHILNMRRRTHVSVPENVCGNFWRCANTRCTVKEVQVGELMELLGASMKRSAAECGKAVGGDELMRESAEALMELCEESELGDFRIFTSWCRFQMYEADFGWGRPSWVSSVHLPVRITVLIDSYDGEGIEAWVSLEDKEMATLETDAHFLTFATSL